MYEKSDHKWHKASQHVTRNECQRGAIQTKLGWLREIYDIA